MMSPWTSWHTGGSWSIPTVHPTTNSSTRHLLSQTTTGRARQQDSSGLFFTRAVSLWIRRATETHNTRSRGRPFKQEMARHTTASPTLKPTRSHSERNETSGMSDKNASGMGETSPGRRNRSHCVTNTPAHGWQYSVFGQRIRSSRVDARVFGKQFGARSWSFVARREVRAPWNRPRLWVNQPTLCTERH